MATSPLSERCKVPFCAFFAAAEQRIGFETGFHFLVVATPAGAQRCPALQQASSPRRAYTRLTMAVQRSNYELGQLQSITPSTYRRTKLFDGGRFRRSFVQVLRQLRQENAFLLIGGVFRPEPFCLLGKPALA
jgi:hypothetical protein